MRKFGALLTNEILKISKKTVVYILLGIMTLAMVGCSALVKFTSNIDEFSELDTSMVYDSEYYEEIEADIKNIENRIQNVGEEDKLLLSKELYDLKSEYLWYEYEVVYKEKYNVGEYSYKMDILYSLIDLKMNMLDIEYENGLITEEDKGNFIANSDDSAKYLSLIQLYEELLSFLEKGTYSEYIDYQKNEILENSSLDDATKESQLEFYDLMLKVCPSGEYSSYEEQEAAEQLLNMKNDLESQLISGIDNDGLSLTDETTEKLKKDLAIVNKKIELSLLDESTSNTLIGDGYVMSFSMGNLFSVIILIIIAGALVSHEVSTGTIKSLIIAPVKRWKIYASKYVAILIFSVALTLYTYIISILINGLLFGFGSYGSEVFYMGGKVVAVNYMLSQLISAFCSLVPVLFFVTLAFVLSALTKSTAASVSISMGVYWGGDLIHLILSGVLMEYPYITKFLPFNNLQWYNMIMYSGNSDLLSMNAIITGNTSQEGSILFSVVYTLTLLVCMLWIGYDSFCRRDIK